MALAVMLMMTLSCRKEQQVNTLNKKGGNTAALRLEPEELEAVTNDFITQSLSEQWNLGTYEYEDAVLILEGALNYRTCTPHEYYDEIAIDSAAFKISITQDEYGKWNADNEKLIASWTNLLEHAQNTRERLENENYFNIVADLEIADVDLDREEITVSVVIWAGLATQVPIYACDYESNDYWNAISYGSPGQCGFLGGCSSNNGNNTSCAAKEITRRVNSQFCFEICEGSYYNNISMTQKSGDFIIPSNLYPCSGLSWAWTGTLLGNNTNECLNPYKMNCYTIGIKNAGNYYSTNAGKCLVSILINEMVPACPCPYTWFINFYMGNPVIYNPN